MRSIVVDIDETLLISSKPTKFFRWIARQFFKLSLLFQKPNKVLIDKLINYDDVIILTARGTNYKKWTEKQLRMHRIKYDRLIMCNYTVVLYQWKMSIIRSLNPTVWVDDVKESVGLEGYK
ncbi:MAG: hypothetical protein QXQ50_07795 [Candidatus Bathyarchaeia archaeon]